MSNLAHPDAQTDTQSATLNPSTSNADSIAPNPTEGGSSSSLPATIAPAPLDLIAPPVSDAQVTALIDAKPLPASAQPRKSRRNGRVANLPKLERELVQVAW